MSTFNQATTESTTHLETPLLSGAVTVGGKIWPWRRWNGEPMVSNKLAFDTETDLAEPGKIPNLAIAQVFDGEQVWLIHPDDMGRFIVANATAFFVMHNVAFDWPVIYQHLCKTDPDAATIWLRIADEDRLRDSMLLDQLVRIAEGELECPPRSLAVVAKKWADITELDKEDPWRMRYGEIIGTDWRQIDREAWEYAAKDAVAPLLAYYALAKRADEIIQSHAVSDEVIEKYGFLTQAVQVKAAIALKMLELRGIRIDQQACQAAEKALRTEIQSLLADLADDPEFRTVLSFDRNSGEVLLTPTGKPKLAQKVLRELLQAAAKRSAIEPPLTPEGEVSLAAKFWVGHQDVAPYIKAWLGIEKKTKLLQFFDKLHNSHVHPSYQTIVLTGRTSCSKPNIQQMPRAGNFREMFVPSPGNVFFTVDYAALELRTLAAVCEQVGESVLAEQFRQGVDPHCYTAAMVKGWGIDEFMEFKQRDLREFKRLRQAAKAVNFGVPGGLGAERLAATAASEYDVNMSLEEAQAFREQLTTVVYPELEAYLDNDVAAILAQNLGCDAKHVREKLGSEPAILGAKNMVAGKELNAKGEPYNRRWVQEVWLALRQLNQREDLAEELRRQAASPSLASRLFNSSVVTLTGRVRGHAAFTERCNTPFQGLASDGAKIALWNLVRANYRVVAFVHDEFVIELPETADFDREAANINAICCESMQSVTGNVPIACEYVVSSCWSKRAELVRDEQGRITVWRPPTALALSA